MIVADKDTLEYLRKAKENLELIKKAKREIESGGNNDEIIKELEERLGVPVFIGENPGRYPALVINTEKDSSAVAWLDVRKGRGYIVTIWIHEDDIFVVPWPV